MSVDWSARDTQGDTLFKCAEGWVQGFKLHPPVTRIPLNQAGFSLPDRRQGYCTNTAPFKKICLVLDLPMVTQEGEAAPVTGHFAFRTLQSRAPYKADSLGVITEVIKEWRTLRTVRQIRSPVTILRALKDEVMTFDSTAPVQVGIGGPKSLVTQFLDHT